ncbi:MAG TPA: DeoR/GlpR family DNA-binding transcription regulator, partial [Polyangiaceae bacterium]|nr:DeoR/GlpR family DNA-binding transcription regulator [Polyangiaceae bacterium]
MADISSIERQGKLVQIIEQRGRILVPEVCAEFDVSIATARRDLDAIAEQGLVRRVHGGAIAARRAPPEGPALERALLQADEKRAIGRSAAALVSSGETIFLGSGTTVLEVARELVDREDLTVITNSLFVLNLLAKHQSISVIALGGLLRRSEMSFIGHLAEQALGDLRANKIIMGIRAIDLEHGLTNDYLPE